MSFQSSYDAAREVNQAERPLEDGPPKAAAGISDEEKALKNAEEVARWDEKKKWELKVEHFKRKLEEANEEVSKVAKSNKGLRDMVARMERERIVLEGRAKASRDPIQLRKYDLTIFFELLQLTSRNSQVTSFFLA